MNESIEANFIQGWLINNSPKNSRGEPLFRLVWSDDQYELVLQEGSKGSVERMKKYNFIKEKWVIEQYYPPMRLGCDALSVLPEARELGSYEPIYVFELPLRLDVAQFVVKMALRPSSSPMKIRSAIVEEMEEREKKLDKETDEIIKDATSSEIMSLLHHGEGIIKP
jgi:hypothetical protein